MRKLTAHIFLCLYLFSTTEAYQVLKFPVVLQHFHEHQGENGNITFLDFLDIHYMHGSPMDADYERDMQLPFKRMNHHVNMIPVHVKEMATVVLAVNLSPKNANFILIDDHNIPTAYSASIFQPPRV